MKGVIMIFNEELERAYDNLIDASNRILSLNDNQILALDKNKKIIIMSLTVLFEEEYLQKYINEINEIKFHSVNDYEPVETIIDLFDRRKNKLNSLI